MKLVFIPETARDLNRFRSRVIEQDTYTYSTKLDELSLIFEEEEYAISTLKEELQELINKYDINGYFVIRQDNENIKHFVIKDKHSETGAIFEVDTNVLTPEFANTQLRVLYKIKNQYICPVRGILKEKLVHASKTYETMEQIFSYYNERQEATGIKLVSINMREIKAHDYTIEAIK